MLKTHKLKSANLLLFWLLVSTHKVSFPVLRADIKGTLDSPNSLSMFHSSFFTVEKVKSFSITKIHTQIQISTIPFVVFFPQNLSV